MSEAMAGVRAKLLHFLRRFAALGLVLLVLAATGVGGYLLGWKTFNPGGGGGGASGVAGVRGDGRGSGARPEVDRGEGVARETPGSTVATALESLRFADHGLGFDQVVHLFNGAGAGQFPALLDEVASLPDSRSRDQLVEALALCWANSDPGGAFGAMRDRLPSKTFLANLYTLVRLWSDEDPSAAYAAYREDVHPLLEGRPYTGAEFTLSMVFGRLASDDFRGALAELQNLEGDEAKYALRGIAGAAREHADDPEFLLPLLDLPDPDQATAFAQIASGLARSGDPRRALEWVDGLPVSGEVSRDALTDVARAWAWEAPVDAAAWAATHQDPDHLATVIRQWADWEPNAAGEWLATLDAAAQPEHAAQAYGGFAVAVVQEDPESALAWAAAISDAGVRERTVRNLARQFRQSVVEDPRPAIAASNLTEEEKHVLTGAVR